MSTYLTPLNDLTFEVVAKHTNPTTGAREGITSGTTDAPVVMTAFLSTSNGPTATAADPTLSVTGTYVGANGSGRWIVSFDAAILTASLLATHFAAATPYCIVAIPNQFRDYVTLTYRESAPATVS